MGNKFGAYIKHPDSESYAKAAFDKYDANGDGTLDHDEFNLFAEDFLSLMTKSKEFLGLTLKKVLDADGASSVGHLAKVLFPKIDVNGDGKISFKEFTDFVHKYYGHEEVAHKYKAEEFAETK
eukprot:TRINITY_DN141318_c0_g1_i2.p1 TRINITY_DN141318_c0_g1~~TRINITY_DN141318_c0_g1_i2.p1  ORF type:complete len:143 (-),score=13.97 TRINITY_DN141318_c0_g1_i2:37-405(-)